MGKLLKNVVKAVATMFIIGCALGVVVPAVAALIGPELLGEAVFAHLSATPVLQTGIFFGLFGGLSAVVTPTVNYIFGERPEKTVTAKALGVKSKTLGYEQAPDPSLAQSTQYQDMIAAQKAAAASQTHSIH